MKHQIFIWIFLSFCNLTTAQNEFSKWCFGAGMKLDFMTVPPTISNSAINSLEACASVADSSGNLLFYASWLNIYNSIDSVMANGSGLASDNTSTQGVMIVKQPNTQNIYYVFTVWANAAYSIVDMSLAAGMGSVTAKNINMYTNTCEKQVAVRHCNGVDAWIVSHEKGTNGFKAYLLTSAGLNPTPVISSSGPIINANWTGGQLKVSPDGKKLTMAVGASSTPTNLGSNGFYLFDFDASNGVVSNPILIKEIFLAYGLEFSPDGTKLYGSVGNPPPLPRSLHQWDLCSGSNAQISASEYSINLPGSNLGSLQRAIDGKVYMVSANTQSIGVINNPNLSGASMNLNSGAINISPKQNRIGLPNFINSYTKTIPQPFNYTITCNQINFSQGSLCGNMPYPSNGYLWDFGEPGSATNTSTLSNPSHLYSSIGTYTVKLMLINNCSIDTITQSLAVTSVLGPGPSVAGPSLICKGDRYTYTVSGGNTYLWSTGSTSTAIALQPTITTVYSVSATSNGCTQSKTFTVNVSPCTGSNKVDDLELLRIYPNPVNNELNIEMAIASTLKVFDLNASLVLEAELNTGSNTINTSRLKAGFYSMSIINSSFTRQLRFLKLED